jgi:hypothetical protein
MSFTVRVKAGLKKEKPKPREKELPRPPSRLARMLALAYLVERLIEQAKVKNYAEAARRLGVSRARMGQIANLVNLPVETQEAIIIGRACMSERRLRDGRRKLGNGEGEASSTPLFTAAAAS